MQIQPDVNLISGKASNFYLCAAEDGLTLIDAGMPKEQQLLFNLLDQLGRQPSQLNRILITHADIDHAGSLAAIQSATGATVYAGEQSAIYLQEGRSPDHLPRFLQWFSNTFFKYRPVPSSCIEILADGDELPLLGGLKALATPGHTADHFSFYSPSTGVLFAGDALNTRNGRLRRTPKRITADEDLANSSAIRLLELTPATIACGHGDPLSDHGVDDMMAFFNELRSSDQ
jgi:glyoxylase-like metal-dependent hydrolase (beta-lactamase superfamily II)